MKARKEKLSKEEVSAVTLFLLEQRIKKLDNSRASIVKDFDIEFAACRYLVVAHGVALATCVASLKDYATVPQLKGMGFFIAMFAAGFVFSVWGWACLSILRSSVMAIFDGRVPGNYKLAAFAAYTFIGLSALLLCSAVIQLAGRLASL